MCNAYKIKSLSGPPEIGTSMMAPRAASCQQSADLGSPGLEACMIQRPPGPLPLLRRIQVEGVCRAALHGHALWAPLHMVHTLWGAHCPDVVLAFAWHTAVLHMRNGPWGNKQSLTGEAYSLLSLIIFLLPPLP